MREILFRAKRIDDGEWVEGFLFSTNEHTYIAYPNQFDDDLFLSPKEIFIEVDPKTVCQYTGLTDKNGRKIFEGDIVRLPRCENDIAVFVLRGCNYFLKGKCSNYELGSCDSECFEVIDNTFDNPELIGE